MVGITIPALASDDKVPGRYGETKYGQGQKSFAVSNRCLITGNPLAAGTMTGGGAVAGDLDRIYDVADADTKLGAGSEAALMAYAALKVPGVELWAAPVLEAPTGAAAATLTITIGGTWAGTGTLTYYVGDKVFVCSVADGGLGSPAAENATVDNMAAVIGADARLFCSTVDPAGAVLTLTLRTKGLRGNTYYVKQDTSDAPTGLTSVLAGGAAVGDLTPFSGGAGTGELSPTTITLISTQEFGRIAVAQNDAVHLALWEAHVDSEASPLIGHLEHIVCGANALQAAAVALAQTTLNAERAELLWSQFDRMAPAAWVAEMAARRAVLEGQTPNYNYDGMVLDSCAGQEPVDVPLHSEQKSALNEGVTPLKTVVGETQVVRAITTKCLDGTAPDYRTLDVGEAIVPDRVRADLIVVGDGYTQENPWAGPDPSDEEGPTPGVATPSGWNSKVEAYLLDRQDDNWITDVADNLPESEWDATAKRIMSAVPCIVRALNHQIGISVRQQQA